MKVILDPRAGICGGVRRAIRLAEEELARRGGRVFVLGDIIHNEREVERLDRAGLKTISRDEIDRLAERRFNAHSAALIRAHGERPETFDKLNRIGLEVIDGTCPVVTRSQQLARQFRDRGYQVAIVGRHGHPEVTGIVGHSGGRAVVVQFDEDLDRLKPAVPTMAMAQTTISHAWFEEMTEKIRRRVGDVEVRDTICRFVVRRDQKLPQFASQADVILVVGGRKSSNTRMLHATCMSINPRSHHVADPSDIEPAWFDGAESIGVTGSASTPVWLLHEFIDTLKHWITQGWPQRGGGRICL